MTATLSSHQLVEQLKETGIKLSESDSSSTEVLKLLDELELLLSKVGQAPSVQVQEALLPSMKVLITNQMLQSSDIDIKVSVAACLNEIMRITAPEPPYSDEKMKEIFELIVGSFDKLSLVNGRCYSKSVSIIDNVAKVRSCVMMLDLECASLINSMFEQFLKNIRSNHPQSVFLAMETIMTLVIDESEQLPLELLRILLTSITKVSEKNSRLSYQLGAKVMKNTADKLKPYLISMVESTEINEDDYAPILGSICRGDKVGEKNNNDSREQTRIKQPEVDPISNENEAVHTTVAMVENEQNRGSGQTTNTKVKKLNFCHLDGDGGSGTVAKGMDDQSLTNCEGNPRKEEAIGQMTLSKDGQGPYKAPEVSRDSDRKQPQSISGRSKGGIKKRGRPRKEAAEGSAGKVVSSKTKLSVMDKDLSQTAETFKKKPRRKPDTADDNVFETPFGKKNYKEDIVGCRIKVLWPEDKAYYEGVIVEFDPYKKRHKVDYDDGDVEVLNLREEIWQFIGDENLLREGQMPDALTQPSSNS